MVIVTRNIADFVATGATLLDPWTFTDEAIF
jgi:hypothetical protein